VTALAASSWVDVGSAQTDDGSVYIARAFIGNCAQNAGRIDKVAAAARAFGWQELEGDMKAMVAPQDPNTKFSGWLVREDGQQPFMLGISEAMLKGVSYSMCVVSSPYVDMESVVTEVRKLTTFGKLLDNMEEAGQRYRVWATEQLAPRSFVSAIDAPKMGITGGTISLSAPTEK